MEIWDVYDNNRVKTDKTITRGQKLTDGECRIVTHVCIFSSDGRLLIQQRQNFKGGWPNKWDFSAAGSAIAGETSLEAALREVKEELGLDLSDVMQDMRATFTINFKHGFDDFYLVNYDAPLSSLTLQPEEVRAARYADMNTIMSLLDDNTFIPYHKSLIALIFDFNKYHGTYTE